MSNLLLSLCKLITLLVAISSFCISNSQQDSHKAKDLCMERTGLGQSDIDSIKYRNENCTVDCLMKQGIVQSYYVKDGTSCWKNDNRCYLGVCRDVDGQKSVSSIINDDLYSIEISIHSAHVADMDDLPGAGGSDTFIFIEVENDGFPTYKKGEVVCYTYVIQDNNKPRWNYKCKPLPMTSETKLKFRALDSDKPFSLNPDKLGFATESVSNLMAKGKTKLRLWQTNNNDSSSKYFVEVEVTGRKYDRK